MIYKKIALACICVGFLASCGPSFKIKARKATPASVDEARLNDIPLPLGVNRLAFYPSETPTACTVHYASRASADDLVVFYYEEMERYGWRLQGRYSMPGELLLIFDKPTRLCAISFRIAKRQTNLIIMTGQKGGG